MAVPRSATCLTQQSCAATLTVHLPVAPVCVGRTFGILAPQQVGPWHLRTVLRRREMLWRVARRRWLAHFGGGGSPRADEEFNWLGVGECHDELEVAAGRSDERAECRQQHVATALQPVHLRLVHLQEPCDRRLRQLSCHLHLRALPDARWSRSWPLTCALAPGSRPSPRRRRRRE